MTELDTEVLVIGAGPAGIAAAVRAAQGGARVMLIDMQAEPGGQVWRGQWALRTDRSARYWMGLLERSSVDCRFGLRLIAVPQAGTALCSGVSGALAVRFRRAVVASGARELMLPFPGWTLPGVFGAGGLQVLVKDGWPVEGKRILISGSGPLLLAAADTLQKHGARVLGIFEQASLAALARFGVSLLCSPGRLLQAGGLAWRLRGIPYRCNSWIAGVNGVGKAEQASVRIAGRDTVFDCDAVAVGFGLLPNLDVAASFGCALSGGMVRVNTQQETSVAGIYCAGEGTGIGGLEQALRQGQIAGSTAAGLQAPHQARSLPAPAPFARAINRAFALRAELRALATAQTLLCRCEKIRVDAVRDSACYRTAKLHHRLGMGHCQGRVCGSAAEFLFGWQQSGPRPPLAPVAIRDLNLLSTNPPENCT